jgi:hypothetical protein
MLKFSVKFTKLALAGNRTLTNADNGTYFYCDTTAADRNIYIPANWAPGNMIYIKNLAGANNVIVSGVGSIVFQDDTTTLSLAAAAYVRIFCVSNSGSIVKLNYYATAAPFVAVENKNNLNFTTFNMYLDEAKFDDTTSGGASLADFTLSFPSINDTLVGRTTTDTLTNKTLTSPTLTTPIIPSFYKAALGNLITVPTPSAPDTLALLAEIQSFSNKTLDSTNVLTQPSIRFAQRSVAFVDSPVIMTGTESFIDCDTTGGVVAITLPALGAAVYGRRYVVRRNTAGGNAVTIAAAGADTIDGSPISLGAQWAIRTIYALGGTHWTSF